MPRDYELEEEMIRIAEGLGSETDMGIRGSQGSSYNTWPDGDSGDCHRVIRIRIKNKHEQFKYLAYALEHIFLHCQRRTRGVILWTPNGAWDEGIWKVMIPSFKGLKKTGVLELVMLKYADERPEFLPI